MPCSAAHARRAALVASASPMPCADLERDDRGLDHDPAPARSARPGSRGGPRSRRAAGRRRGSRGPSRRSASRCRRARRMPRQHLVGGTRRRRRGRPRGLRPGPSTAATSLRLCRCTTAAMSSCAEAKCRYTADGETPAGPRPRGGQRRPMRGSTRSAFRRPLGAQCAAARPPRGRSGGRRVSPCSAMELLDVPRRLLYTCQHTKVYGCSPRSRHDVSFLDSPS